MQNATQYSKSEDNQETVDIQQTPFAILKININYNLFNQFYTTC